MDVFKAHIFEMLEDRIFQIQIFVCHIFALYAFIAAYVTDNYSQVDRLWSIIPSLYAWSYVYFEYSTHGTTTDTFFRLIILAILMTSWSIRLTFNYWRKGGYTVGSEDYRWEHVKKFFNYPKNKFLYQLFNLTFIALFQNWLLYAITLPLWYIQKFNRREEFNYYDLALTLLFVAALAMETTADEQQWDFQSQKHKWLKTKKITNTTKYTEADFKRGFLVKGLFKYTRHPNFFGELSIWWIIFAFTLSSQYNAILKGKYERVINPSVIGVVALTLLFQGSTNLTEKLSIAKYPNYKVYQKTVSRLIPSIFSNYRDETKQ